MCKFLTEVEQLVKPMYSNFRTVSGISHFCEWVKSLKVVTSLVSGAIEIIHFYPYQGNENTSYY
jgi:hypothetical protein